MQNIQFCQKISSFFKKKSLSILNLVIALASDGKAKSVTELANNPLYKYKYSSITDAINCVFEKEPDDKQVDIIKKRLDKDKKLLQMFSEFFPEKYKNKFYLLNTDASSIYREHSPTLEDRGFVYKANEKISGNKPVTIGYSMSAVGINAREDNVSWNLPLSCLRIPTGCNTNTFTAKQVINLVETGEVFGNNLIVNALDSGYFNINYIYPTHNQANLVNLIRIKSNRKLYFQYAGEQSKDGAKKRYGNLFRLNDNKTHTEPVEKENLEIELKNGRKCKVKIRKWDNMIIPGQNNQKMYDKPFNLIAIDIFDLTTGDKIFNKTMWLAVTGKRKNELTLTEIYHSYRLRFDIEFFFRFGKQKLLLDKYQTPDVEHQENWFIIVMLSYWLLYLSRYAGDIIINDWEKYLEKYKNQESKEQEQEQVKSPTMTSRAMPGIISGFVNKYIIPKTRNNTSGRLSGDNQKSRERHSVVKKSEKVKKKLEIDNISEERS